MQIDGRPLRKIRRQALDVRLSVALERVINLDVDLKLFGAAELEELFVDTSLLSFPPVTQCLVDTVDVAFLSVAGQSVLKEPSGLALYRAYTAYVRGQMDKPSFATKDYPEAPDDLFFLDPVEPVNQSAFRAISFVTYLCCRFGLSVTHEGASYFVECKGRRFGIEDGKVLGVTQAPQIDATAIPFALRTRRKWPERTPSLDYLARILTVIGMSDSQPAREVSDALCLLFMLSERVRRGEFLSIVSNYIESGVMYETQNRKQVENLLVADASYFAVNDLRTIVEEIQWGTTNSTYWTQLPSRLRSAGLTAATARKIYFRKEGADSKIRPRPELIVSKLMSVIKELES